MRRDPLRDRVVSVAAVHLQLHRLPAPERQRVRAEHAGEVQRFSNSAGRAEWLAPHLAERHAGDLAVLWKLRHRLYGERDGRPETVSLRAGTLDDTSWLVPVAHFFTRSAQPWVQPAPGAQCFETQPNGWGSLLPAMACPLDRSGRLNAARALFTIPFPASRLGLGSLRKKVPARWNRLKPWGITVGLGGCFGGVDCGKSEERNLGPG